LKKCFNWYLVSRVAAAGAKLVASRTLHYPAPAFDIHDKAGDMGSKKEQQRRIREEKQEQARRKEKLGALVFKALAIVLLPLVLFVLYRGYSSGVSAPSPAEVDASDHVLGAADAPVTLVVYGDFQCPACKDEAEVVGRAWRQISERVQLVFRHYPLDTHRHAFLAARYAEAAARQDRFWDMYSALYAEQALWSSTENAAEVIEALAAQLGLDVEQLRVDAELPEVRAKIVADQRGGTRAGVRATPSLFLNGRPVATPRGTTELLKLIERAEADAAGGAAVAESAGV
jgi:protein-disulfide isomerase